METGAFPQAFISVKGRIVDVDETQQVVVIKDYSGVVHTASLSPADVQQSTWLSTPDAIIGLEASFVRRPDSLRSPWVILSPDIVVDVTEAAQLVTLHGVAADQVLVKRLRKSGAMSLALTGSLVNAAFDILARSPVLTNDEIIHEAKRTRPLSLAAAAREGSLPQIDDVLIKAMIPLREMFISFSSGTIVLEPHYISPTFGLQGRADICVRMGLNTLIVEMKAGKAASGVSIRPDHAAQVAGYAALVQATQPQSNVTAKIWYVQASDAPLRNVDNIDEGLSLLVSARNVIIATDIALKHRKGEPLKKILGASTLHGGSSYDEHARVELASTLTQLDRTEIRVVRAWLGYTAGDHEMVRIGGGSSRSTADLWRQAIEEKRRSSTVILDLQFNASESDVNRMHLSFVRGESFGECALRIGDPVILYPEVNGQAKPCDGPLLKAALRGMSATTIEVSLRNKYASAEDLHGQRWILEQDVLDTSVRSFYAAIRTFVDSEPSQRMVLLGRRAPTHRQQQKISAHDLTDEQRLIVERALASNELFLIQGPPGTGKTSAVLRTIIAQLTQRSDERVLAVAYTNRAANEISAVLTRYNIDHLRHGSSEGALGESSIPVLGQRLSANELAEVISNSRCIVSTVQSLYSSSEIWDFGSFTTAVIDEASQVLEPPLIGITCRVGRSILMGDQCQLPAVVTQRADSLHVRGPEFEALMMTDLGMSAFERLMNCAYQRGDEASVAMLTKQGRMHQDVMEFVSDQFYSGKLKTLADWQQSEDPLPWSAFIPSRTGFIAVDDKSDQAGAEARTLVALATRMFESASAINCDFSIGIITPFRVQNNAVIAMLPNKLQGLVTVDTVERFQGSERDVILYGTAVGSFTELESIISEATIGGIVIDRKLNVAMTRARQQFILVGNPTILSHSSVYAKAIRQLSLLCLE